jgi:regulator of sirC expression with transglutaminase-like and TPR domain
MVGSRISTLAEGSLQALRSATPGVAGAWACPTASARPWTRAVWENTTRGPQASRPRNFGILDRSADFTMYEPIPALAYFRLLVGDADSIPLFEAAASIALDAHPTLDLQGTLASFDGLARRLADECRGASTERARLQRALRFFYVKQGFAGNVQSYYDPENSYLHRVLETRRCIPISLAVLFAELARHVGLDADGVAFPGHFLLRINLHEGVAVIDPFTGTSLDRDELDRWAAPHRVATERLLQPASARQILMRMLTNLQAIHAQQGHADLLAKVEERMRILQGESARARGR